MRVWIGLILLVLFCAPVAHASLTREAKQRVREAPSVTYDIAVAIDPDGRKYMGSSRVSFTNRAPKSTNYLLFFLYPNDPGITKSKEQYMNVSAVKVNGSPARTETNGPSLRVYLPESLNPSQNVAVDIDFSATIPEQSGNKDMFSQAMEQLQTILNPDPASNPDYGIYSSGKEILNLGLWYPALSKYDADGWDEEAYSGIGDVSYYDPADFHVAIKLPSGFRVVTSGSTVRKMPVKNGFQEHLVEATQSRDFVIEVSKLFEQKDALRGATAIRSHYLSRHRQSGLKVAEYAAQAFEYYESAFGRYPYTELDVVEAPLYGGAGGVEFPGLVTVSSMLYKDEDARETDDMLRQLLAQSPAMDDLLEFVVAHEVAHQWWNSVVGSNSKKYPYIDEAMSNYSAVLYFEHYHGRPAAERQMNMQMKLNYQVHRLAGGLDRPVILPASSYSGPLEYSAIVYGKGALYFDKLRSVMGDAPFFDAMKRYYNEYWFRIAGPQDFTRIAEERAPEKKDQIRATYKRWLEEEHGDEDIGKGTLEAMMPLLLPNTPEGLSTDQKELMKQIEELLKLLDNDL